VPDYAYLVQEDRVFVFDALLQSVMKAVDQDREFGFTDQKLPAERVLALLPSTFMSPLEAVQRSPSGVALDGHEIVGSADRWFIECRELRAMIAAEFATRLDAEKAMAALIQGQAVPSEGQERFVFRGQPYWRTAREGRSRGPRFGPARVPSVSPILPNLPQSTDGCALATLGCSASEVGLPVTYVATLASWEREWIATMVHLFATARSDEAIAKAVEARALPLIMSIQGPSEQELEKAKALIAAFPVLSSLRLESVAVLLSDYYQDEFYPWDSHGLSGTDATGRDYAAVYHLFGVDVTSDARRRVLAGAFVVAQIQRGLEHNEAVAYAQNALLWDKEVMEQVYDLASMGRYIKRHRESDPRVGHWGETFL
jgi:hypothetical protein